jgi:hypothetical protein
MIYRVLEQEPGTVFYIMDIQIELVLSGLDYDPGIVSVGKKSANKLAIILNKNSPFKPMFDQVLNLIFFCF